MKLMQFWFILVLESILLFGASSTLIAEDDACRPPFPKASPPYAKAPDGCSSWSNNPKQVRDSWPFLGRTVSFRPACDAHDRCYYTEGSDFNTCNIRFFQDMERACREDLRNPIKICMLSWDLDWDCHTEYLPPEPASLTACYAIATSYYTAVEGAAIAGRAFLDAQRCQQDYNNWVSCKRGTIYVDKLAPGKEAGTTAEPFHSVAKAKEMACSDVNIRLVIKSNHYQETLTLDRPMEVVAEGGAVTIGAPSVSR
ncbi:MAG: hypothetical protein IAE85_16445 [Anaerolinea sp.]|nr:hypothetical protein [Anaerolinea sp.]